MIFQYLIYRISSGLKVFINEFIILQSKVSYFFKYNMNCPFFLKIWFKDDKGYNLV